MFLGVIKFTQSLFHGISSTKLEGNLPILMIVFMLKDVIILKSLMHGFTSSEALLTMKKIAVFISSEL